MDLAPDITTRLRLAVRTSMRSEFRDAHGALGFFELSYQFTSIGALCTSLAQLPGVAFQESGGSLWSTGPSRFTFLGRTYAVSTPFEDVRVAPVEEGAVYPETEELLRLICEYLFPKWQSRARSRFFRM
jgi:hypothetical protein